MPVVAAAAPPTTAVLRKSRRPKFCSVMVSSRGLRSLLAPDDVRDVGRMRLPDRTGKRGARSPAMRSGVGGIGRLGAVAPDGAQHRHDAGAGKEPHRPKGPAPTR